MKKQKLLWVGTILVAAVVVLAFLAPSLSRINRNSTDFTVTDQDGTVIDYKGISLSENSPSSSKAKARIFTQLDQAIAYLSKNNISYTEGEVAYTANGDRDGAIAIFNFMGNRQIKLESYIDSPLLWLPIIYSKLVDLNGDGHKDVFVITTSGNYLNVDIPWFFIYRTDGYHLAVPFTQENVDPQKALSGEEPAVNAMEVRMSPGATAFWLKDLNGDGSLEVITLDEGSFSPSGNELTERIYELKDDSYSLQSEKQIRRGDQEYKEIESWPVIPSQV